MDALEGMFSEYQVVVTETDAEGNTALHFVVASAGKSRFLAAEILIKSGVDADAENSVRFPASNCLCFCESTHMLRPPHVPV